MFESGNLWAAVSAIAAAYAIFQVRKIQKDSHESFRPYFLLKDPGIKSLENSPPFRIMITMINEGGRPAIDLEYRIVALPVGNGKKPTIDVSESISNPIPKGSPTPWYNDSFIPGRNVPSHFVFLGLKYGDSGSKNQHTQAFLMRWHGVEDGKLQPDFVHTSKKEEDEFYSMIPSLAQEYK